MNTQKKYIKVFGVLLLIFTISLLLFQINQSITAKELIKKERAVLPIFEFSTLKGDIFSSSAINKSQIIINYFNSECEHCHYQTKELTKLVNEDLLIIMVSAEGPDILKAFVEKFGLGSYQHITVLTDVSGSFYQVFGENSIPSLFIYKNGQLKKIFKGETKHEALAQILASQ